MKYIGQYKIKKATHNPDGTTTVTFQKKTEVTLARGLFELVASEEPLANAEITDAITHTIAVKFLDELANYNLDYYFVKTIGTKLEVLAHNLREDLIRRTFDCSGGDAISLKKLLWR